MRTRVATTSPAIVLEFSLLGTCISSKRFYGLRLPLYLTIAGSEASAKKILFSSKGKGLGEQKEGDNRVPLPLTEAAKKDFIVELGSCTPWIVCPGNW